jgi:hypothetical protein
MNIIKRMAEEIRAEIANGEELEAIKDRSGEFIDSYLPIYNNKIIEEWQAMPSDYDNRGSAELGHLEHEINIINLMSLDLYLYYSDLFAEAISEVEQSLELATVEAIKEGAE